MYRNYANKNLRNASFRNEDLSNANFAYSDLRGAHFDGANLNNVDLTHVKTGIPPLTRMAIFIVTLAASVISGYFAALTAQTVHKMLVSSDAHVKLAGIITLVTIALFLLYSYWKGGQAIRFLLLPAAVFATVAGIVVYSLGIGSGQGALFMVISFLLMAVLFIVGTVARALAGSLSNVLFLVVAISGSVVSKNLSGGVGTVVVAITCALVSKRAMQGVKGFEGLRKITSMATAKFGTSFRNSQLAGANFSCSTLRNSDFSGADTLSAKWGNAKRINCVDGKSDV
jgi:hypothetical protein